MEDKKKRGKLNYYIIMKANFKSLNILMFCAFLFTFNFTKPTIINIFLFIIHFGWVSKAQSAGMNLSLASYKAESLSTSMRTATVAMFYISKHGRKDSTPNFATSNALQRMMRTHVFYPNFQEENLSFSFFNSFNYLFIYI